NQTMSFTSNNERPHQPVRIYRKHFGRCGEYADYTAAVARTALIPCTSILSMSTDHTWNEFWDERWVMWEPVNGYLDIPLVYENGWGKVFGSVFEIRSDGFLAPVTERYSEGLATIHLSVVDENNIPIDGAKVVLAFWENAYRVDMVSFTDNEGLVVFPVGENRSYFARVETSFALYPPIAGTYSALAQNAEDGQDYYYQFVMQTPLPQPTVNTIEPPVDNADDWRYAIVYNVPRYYLSGRVTWDDISAQGIPSRFYKEVSAPGDISYLITDADNVLFYQIMLTCEAYQYQYAMSSVNAVFDIPLGQDYYAFVDNSHRHATAQYIEGAILYKHWGVNLDDMVIPPVKTALYPNHPNPFNPQTALSYYLDEAQTVCLEVYNLRGQLVDTVFQGESSAGKHTVYWNARNADREAIASGIYYVRLKTPKTTHTQKMLLLK
ncbi:MAG: FlgD immunoglobulin-like domain containing protein, partial [Candidatus Cloacimonadaceae bacterium]|nr:FlgD immunoglobulin-like domain containing protein [Candidatus Cloacimonadaceae bacterium]